MRQLQIAGFLIVLFLNLLFAATAFSAEPLVCEAGALKVELNRDNQASRQEILQLHQILKNYREGFDVLLADSPSSAIAFSVIQFNYNDSVDLRKEWRQIQTDFAQIKNIHVSCDNLPMDQSDEPGSLP